VPPREGRVRVPLVREVWGRVWGSGDVGEGYCTRPRPAAPARNRPHRPPAARAHRGTSV